MGLVLSTSWNAFRYNKADALLFEIKSAGFDEVELSFNLTAPMVAECGKLARSQKIKVRSLHNFCPIPDGVAREEGLPDYYSMASLDEDERKRSVVQTKNTIDTACGLNARAVVLHAGRVETSDFTRQLIQLCQKNGSQSCELKNLRENAVNARRETADKHFQQCLKSLEEINRHAVKVGIALGVENRFYYREIPTFEETGIILNTFKGSNLHYWHDTGHAQIMDELGLARHKDFLEAYKDNLLGMHLHDVLAGQDHLPPGKGGVDFKTICSYLKPQTIKVMEVHHPATAQDLKEGRRFLESILNGKS